MTETWDKLPLDLMDEFAERESYRRDVYRPPYSMHKWWARRPGSTFRILGLACLTSDDVSKDDILREQESEGYDGLYFQNNIGEFDDIVLDPFAGGGTTLLEFNRLGADTIGYELNPVAWFINKKMIDEVDLQSLREKWDTVLNNVRDQLDEYYQTNDPDTGAEAEVLYSFLAQQLPCQSCDETVELHSRYTLRYKKKQSDAVVYCPNCEDLFTLSREVKDEETCPNCDDTFGPNDGNCGYGKFTCSNGHKCDIKESLNRMDRAPEFNYYAIQYKDRTGEKKYKTPDDFDQELLNTVKEYVEENYADLTIPRQDVPDGDKTQALLNYNYDSFDDLFTYRQLLTFSTFINEIKNVDDGNLREFFMLAISNTIHYNSKLSKWETNYQYGYHAFDRHAYVPISEPVEGNPLNTDENLVSAENNFEKIYDAKKYNENPFEKVKVDGSVEKIQIQNESVSEDRLLDLQSKTSERLELDDESVDYVVTDPPYFDNVQYSELSDYFYVWLREGLKDEYEEFEPERAPKAREIVANTQAQKGEDFFINSLSNVFSECERVLKEDGEMVFTYHHNENEAWSVILEALIRSGLTITAAYPVQSEYPNNMHVHELDSAEYDILIYANKDRLEEGITLTELRQNLFFELQDMAAEERERHEDLSKADLGVILRGKCMYYYSRHYPNVYSEGEQAGINEALDTVDSIIEQVLEGSVNLPASIDPLSEAYAAFTQRGSEDYDDLNKHLLAKNLNVSDLEDEKLVKGPRDKKEPATADERIHYIESKLNKNGKGADGLLNVDKVQYLYHLYKTDQNTVEYLKEWKSDDLEDLADFMADVTDDDRYESVMEMGLSQF